MSEITKQSGAFYTCGQGRKKVIEQGKKVGAINVYGLMTGVGISWKQYKAYNHIWQHIRGRDTALHKHLLYGHTRR